MADHSDSKSMWPPPNGVWASKLLREEQFNLAFHFGMAGVPNFRDIYWQARPELWLSETTNRLSRIPAFKTTRIPGS
jgi:hypothetical protein